MSTDKVLLKQDDSDRHFIRRPTCISKHTTRAYISEYISQWKTLRTKVVEEKKLNTFYVQYLLFYLSYGFQYKLKEKNEPELSCNCIHFLPCL
jgi:hypothetical protein